MQVSKNYSFGCNIEEHNSYGSKRNQDGSAEFKVWLPNSTRAFVEINSLQDNGDCFFKNIDCPVKKSSVIAELNKKNAGIYTAKINSNIPKNAVYRYLFFDNSNKLRMIEDPYSKEQAFDSGSWSKLVPSAQNVQATYPKEKIDINNLKILEIHLGTFTDEGTLNSATKKLASIKKDGIFNAVEVLPLAECNGNYNWGYDGNNLFAVESSYGNTQDFKNFVREAHRNDLKVIVDVVYNHYGPNANYIKNIGEYSSGKTEWGLQPNFKEPEVCNLFINNALYWLTECECDGLRLDASHILREQNPELLKNLKSEIQEHAPNAFIIAEDPHPDSVKPDKIGLDAHWEGILPIFNEDKINSEKFLEKFLNPKKVTYFESHDEVALTNPDVMRGINANYSSNRLFVKIIQKELDLDFETIQKLMDSYAQNRIEKNSQITCTTIPSATHYRELQASGKTRKQKTISEKTFSEAIQKAKNINNLAIAATMLSEGPKMIFMGDDELNLSPFKFFADNHARDTKRYPLQKEFGYFADKQDFRKSKLNALKLTNPECVKYNNQIKTLFKDLNTLKEKELKTTKETKISHQILNDNLLVIKKSTQQDEKIILINLGNKPVPLNDIPMIKKEHSQIFNSQNPKYGGDKNFDTSVSQAKSLIVYKN